MKDRLLIKSGLAIFAACVLVRLANIQDTPYPYYNYPVHSCCLDSGRCVPGQMTGACPGIKLKACGKVIRYTDQLSARQKVGSNESAGDQQLY